jgi:class 3 adenylate cyclase
MQIWVRNMHLSPPTHCREKRPLTSFPAAAGFTEMSSSLSSVELMDVLNTVYSRFDELVEDAGLWKVETVRDYT